MADWSCRSVALLGLTFDDLTMVETVEVIQRHIEDGGFHQVATANVDFAVHALRDPSLQETLCSCDLVVPDGMPIVWASRLMGAGLKERVSGIDLIPRLAELASKRRYGIYLLGASERSSQRAAEALRSRFPSLRIVGRYSPPITPLSEMDHEAILSRIEQAQPDILLVAMGHPKQERWLAMHRLRLKVPLCMGVGASLDMLAGEFSRAPIWMQSAGLEWLYRAAQEPRRLTQRYLKDAYCLARHLPAQVAANAIQPRRGNFPTVLADRLSDASIITISGNLTGSLATEFERELGRAYRETRHIILDLAKTTYLGIDSLGRLVRLARRMNRQARQIWLSATPPHVTRVFRAGRMTRYFGIATSVNDAIDRVVRSEMRSASETIIVHRFVNSGRDEQMQTAMLKDLCRKIVFFSQNPKFDGGRVHASSSAVR